MWVSCRADIFQHSSDSFTVTTLTWYIYLTGSCTSFHILVFAWTNSGYHDFLFLQQKQEQQHEHALCYTIMITLKSSVSEFRRKHQHQPSNDSYSLTETSIHILSPPGNYHTGWIDVVWRIIALCEVYNSFQYSKNQSPTLADHVRCGFDQSRIHSDSSDSQRQTFRITNHSTTHLFKEL